MIYNLMILNSENYSKITMGNIYLNFVYEFPSVKREDQIA